MGFRVQGCEAELWESMISGLGSAFRGSGAWGLAFRGSGVLGVWGWEANRAYASSCPRGCVRASKLELKMKNNQHLEVHG